MKNEDKSIYELENTKRVQEIMAVMKVVMVKGVGYILIGKDSTLTSDTLLNIATSMEDRGLKI